ncbi:MAG: response regulator [Candidatus Aminicenantes bacterium]|nr:response regulator [Candidatus Aminicenantes bacterium]
MTDVKRRILIVDDERSVVQSIALALAGDAVEVETVLSGEDALIRTAAVKYDLIICDLMMPGLSGLDLLKSLREFRPTTPVLMITGYPTIKTAEESVKMGAFAYITKPFTPADIRNAAARALESADFKK